MAATAREWIVHPNRSALGPNKPGQNGHFRSVKRSRPQTSELTCQASVQLPPGVAADEADPDSSITFAADNWRFVTCVARSFVAEHINSEVPPPFGFKHHGRWWWWDSTTTDTNILETPDAVDYVGEYLEELFPGYPITITQR